MNTVTGLSLGRIAVGAAALAKPELLQSSMGVDTSSPVLTQWFGSREVALGAATLLSSGRARTTLVLLGLGVDGADAATAFAAVDRKEIPQQLGLGMVGVAAGAVLAGVLGLRVRKQTTVTVD